MNKMFKVTTRTLTSQDYRLTDTRTLASCHNVLPPSLLTLLQLVLSRVHPVHLLNMSDGIMTNDDITGFGVLLEN